MREALGNESLTGRTWRALMFLAARMGAAGRQVLCCPRIWRAQLPAFARLRWACAASPALPECARTSLAPSQCTQTPADSEHSSRNRKLGLQRISRWRRSVRGYPVAVEPAPWTTAAIKSRPVGAGGLMCKQSVFSGARSRLCPACTP